MFGFGAGRALALIACGWLGLLVVASLQAALPSSLLAGRALLPLLSPNLALLVVIFVGLTGRGNLAGVCALGAAIGYLADLITGAPRGVHLGAYLLVALALRGSARFLVRGSIATAIVSGLFTLLFGAALIGLRRVVGLGWGFGLLRAVPLEALSTALVAPFVFLGLTRLDRLFVRMAPSGRDVRGVPVSR